MDRLEWKKRIDDTDISKQKSKVDKRKKRKVQCKSRQNKKDGGELHQAPDILNIDPWYLTPLKYDEHYKNICLKLKGDAMLISGWRDKWQLPIDFDPKTDSRRARSPIKDQSIPAWERHKPAGFSTLSPKRN